MKECFILDVGIGNSTVLPFVRVYRYRFENLILTINTKSTWYGPNNR